MALQETVGIPRSHSRVNFQAWHKVQDWPGEESDHEVESIPVRVKVVEGMKPFRDDLDRALHSEEGVDNEVQ